MIIKIDIRNDDRPLWYWLTVSDRLLDLDLELNLLGFRWFLKCTGCEGAADKQQKSNDSFSHTFVVL